MGAIRGQSWMRKMEARERGRERESGFSDERVRLRHSQVASSGGRRGGDSVGQARGEDRWGGGGRRQEGEGGLEGRTEAF